MGEHKLPRPTLGDAPIEERYREHMNALANAIDEYLNGPPEERAEPKKNGFIVIMFEFGLKGRANYISNASRQDVITLLKEQLARFEGFPQQEGRG